jgi:hypothetical protein
MKTAITKFQMGLFFISFTLLALCAKQASAQANYNGGQAGGYASVSVSLGTSVTIGDSFTTPLFEVSVFPNPLKKGQALKYRIRNVEYGSKVTVMVSDILGNRLLVKVLEVSFDDSELGIPHDKMTKGIYLITFQNAKSKITRRISYTE